MFSDIRFGLRMLARTPGFTAVAVISLSLGIGVATAAFSEFNGFVLRDVPGVRNPDEVVALNAPVSYPDYQRYKARTDLFSTTFAYAAPVPFGVSAGKDTVRTWGHIVTPSYFPALGIGAGMGRVFRENERAPNVVVSYRFWQNHLGSDPAAVGKALRVNGQTCTLIGVMPKDFQGASPLAYAADLWLPVEAAAAIAPELGDRTLDRHDRAIFHLAGRLQPGIRVESAEAALDAIARQIEIDHGDPNRNRPGRRATVVPGGKLLPVKKEDLRFMSVFFTLLGGLILLIASSNVANMTLARAADRRREIAVRLALGAGRGRLVRQLMTESLIVAAVSGALGFGMASLLMRAASREKMPWPMPLEFNLAPDTRVLLFCLGLTVFTGVAFGLLPALRATNTDLTPALKQGDDVRLARFHRLSLRNVLVVSQVAGSLALLLITGFLVIGYQRITGLDVGFDAQRLYLISLDPVRAGYTPARTAAFFPKLLDRLHGSPALQAASMADAVPMTMIGKPRLVFTTEGSASKVVHGGIRYRVSRDFFDTMGIPVVRGRGFRETDETNDSRVAIVSEKLVRECWNGQDPVGRRIELGGEELPSFMGGGGQPRVPKGAESIEVIGVAKNVRVGLDIVAENAPAVIYVPLRPADYAQPGLQGLTVIVRAAPGVDVVAAVRHEISAMDDNLKPIAARSMPDQIGEIMFPVTVAEVTYAAIGLFGLILAAVGLAGVTAYSVVQRRREIGIRMALGARRGDVLRLVMKESVWLIAFGSVLGLMGARAGIRALAAVMAQVARTAGTSTSDPMLLVGAPLVLALLALASCYVPARRTAEIDPVVTLRAE